MILRPLYRGPDLPTTLAVDITAAASASNGIAQATNVQNNFGTGNFALQWRGSVPDWTPTANVILLNKHDGTNGYILTLLTTGILRTTINGTNYDSTVATGITDNYVAVIDVDITRSSASAAGSVVYTLNGVILGTSVAITAGAPVTVDNTSSLYVCGTSAVRSASQWFSHRLLNFAKTVAENLGMFVNGVPASYVGASQTAVYTSDFSAGTNSWATASSTTAAGNIDGIGGKDNNLRATTNGTSLARIVRTFSAAQFQKNNRLTIEMYRPSANVTCTQADIRLTVGTSTTGSISFGDFPLAADAWTTITLNIPVSMVTNSATAISILFADAAGGNSNNTNGDILYLASSGTLTQTGITSELLAANARNDLLTVTDSSGNAQNATLPAAGATVVTARK
jgi:hypothetical protein